MKLTAALFSILIIACFACDLEQANVSNSSNSDPNQYISFDVDSSTYIPIDIRENTFAFMLQHEKNVLWYGGNDNRTRRINLMQPNIEPEIEMPSLLHELRFDKRNFIQDESLPHLLWIYRYGKDGLKYDATTGLFYPIPVAKLKKLYVLKSKVLIEDTQSNLFLLDKETDKLDMVSRPDMQGIYFVREIDDIGVCLNQYYYDEAEKIWKEIQELRGTKIEHGLNWYAESDSAVVYAPGRVRNEVMAIVGDRLKGPQRIEPNRVLEYPFFWSFSQRRITKWELRNNIVEETEVHLPLFKRQMLLNDKDRIWIASQDGLFSFEKAAKAFMQYDGGPDPKSGLLSVFKDDRHLYLVQEDGIRICNKDFLLEHSNTYNDKKYKAQTKKYLAGVEAIKDQDIPFYPDFLDSIQAFEQRFENYLSVFERDDHLSYVQKMISSDPFREKFIRAFLTGKIDDRFLHRNLFYAIKTTARKGELRAVLSMDSVIRESYPNIFETPYENKLYEPGMEVIKNIQQQRDSLKENTKSEAAYLYNEALVFQQLCKTAWYHESVCDRSLALQKMKDLISSYPDSEYRDDAEFFILDLYNREDEGGMVMDDDPYSAFLTKFPDSNLRKKALLSILEFYAIGYMKDKSKQRRLGQEIADQLIREYPSIGQDALYKSYLSALGRW